MFMLGGPTKSVSVAAGLTGHRRRPVVGAIIGMVLRAGQGLGRALRRQQLGLSFAEPSRPDVRWGPRRSIADGTRSPRSPYRVNRILHVPFDTASVRVRVACHRTRDDRRLRRSRAFPHAHVAGAAGARASACAFGRCLRDRGCFVGVSRLTRLLEPTARVGPYFCGAVWSLPRWAWGCWD